MINDTDSALLFNKESMTYNQIKTDEIPLMDETGCGWVVGYVPKNFPKGDEPGYSNTISTVISLDGTPTSYVDYDELPFNVSTDGTIDYMNLDNEMDIYTYIPISACQKYQVYSSRFYRSGQYWARLAYRRGSSVNITQMPAASINNSYTNLATGLMRWTYSSNYEVSTDLTVNQALSNTSGLSTQGVNQALSGSFYKDMRYGNWYSNNTSQDIYAYLNTFLDEGFTSSSKYMYLFAPNSLNSKNTTSFIDAIMASISNYPNTPNDLMSYNGMIIKYSDNNFYTLSITKSESLYVQSVGNAGHLYLSGIHFPN